MLAPKHPCAQPGCPVLLALDQQCHQHPYHSHRPTRHQRGYTNDWLRLSQELVAHQPWCTYCGSTSDLTTDHIIPTSKGGTNDYENLQVLCRGCNTGKANAQRS